MEVINLYKTSFIPILFLHFGPKNPVFSGFQVSLQEAAEGGKF